MEEILEKLLKIPGVEGALVVGKDGLVITSVGSFSPDPDSFGAGVAELINQFESTLQSKGSTQRVTVNQDQAVLQLTAINEVTFLVCQGGPATNVGRLRLDSDTAASALSEQL